MLIYLYIWNIWKLISIFHPPTPTCRAFPCHFSRLHWRDNALCFELNFFSLSPYAWEPMTKCIDCCNGLFSCTTTKSDTYMHPHSNCNNETEQRKKAKIMFMSTFFSSSFSPLFVQCSSAILASILKIDSFLFRISMHCNYFQKVWIANTSLLHVSYGSLSWDDRDQWVGIGYLVQCRRCWYWFLFRPN